MPGIYDAKVYDATTAFFIALARRDLPLVKSFLSAEIESDIDPKALTARAVLEMDRDPDNDNSELKETLKEWLETQKGTNLYVLNLYEEEAPKEPLLSR